MEQNVKFQLAQMLYSTMNLSFETVLDVLGYDVEDERAKRERENEEGITDVFAPRPTAYTLPADSGNSGSGNGKGKGKGDGKNDGNGNGDGGGEGNGSGQGKNGGRSGQVGKNANQVADPMKKRGRPKTSLDEDKSLYDSLRYQNSK